MLESTFMLVDCEDQSRPQCMSCYAGADHIKQNLSQQGLELADIFIWLCNKLDLALKLSEAVHCVYLSWGLLDRYSGTDQYLILPVLWQPVCGYQLSTVYGCLCWVACAWEGPNWAPRLVLTSLEPWKKGPGYPIVLFFLPLPSSCLLGSVTEKASGCTPIA
ncbi:hypothetical protein HJG60_011496 [Phyllostomus discolor]|uniref:Uncharacterized protein n=1 Tax=Phyllostomus discolor TaxID=89673 RepID=A0A833ZVC1_9CHIR|nr:hypothetical protein HJG60_011496 [Phyllostomus discolor]